MPKALALEHLRTAAELAAAIDQRDAGSQRRPGVKPNYKPVDDHSIGSMLLEIVWTVIPLGLSMIMFVWGVSIYFTESRPPADSMEVYVTGKQWMWKIQHMEGAREINELHIPVGRNIKLTMTSEDVIHDFFIPAFRTKADVLPGRYTTEWFQATKVNLRPRSI